MTNWALTILVTFGILVKTSVSVEEFWLESPRVTNWGTWGNEERCPAGQYATGFRLKDEKYQGDGDSADDTALNGIQLFCNSPGGISDANTISSKVGGWGDWKGKHRCMEGMLVGFQLRSEGEGGDDTAANNLRMFCSNADIGRIEGDGSTWGYWTNEQKCAKRQAICGIRTQVEDGQGSSDDTSLNNVDMLCCNVVSPASICKPRDAWYEIVSCTNTGVSTPLKCQYSYKTGVGYSSTSSKTTTEEASATQSIGFSIGAEIKFLQMNFESSFEWSQSTSHSWSSESTNSWSEEKTVTTDFEVPPGRKKVLSQVVGKCGNLEAFTIDFKLDEFDLHGNPLISKHVSEYSLDEKHV